MARTHQYNEQTDQPTRAPLLRWSSVLGGVVIGGALLLLLSTLWLALAAATNVQAVADGLGWFLAASAIVALFVGGWLAAALSGVPGVGPGIVNGLAVWGVILLLSAVVGTPGIMGAWAQPGLDLPALQVDQALWPAFWSLLVGAVTAGIGGAIGGLTTRGEPAAMAYAERGRGDYRDDRDRDDRRYRDDRGYRDERDHERVGAYREDQHSYGEERGFREERGVREERERRDQGVTTGRDRGEHTTGRGYDGRDYDERPYGEQGDRPKRAGEPSPSERAYAERQGRETDRDTGRGTDR